MINQVFVRAVLGLASLCVSQLAYAQAYEQVGIRAQGMAGAFLAVADDATATWWNPAGLATGALFSGVVERNESDGEGRTTGVAFTLPSFGFSYYRLRVRQIAASPSTTGASAAGRQEQGAVAPGVSSFELSQWGATGGQSIGDHLVIASTAKLVRTELDTDADIDIGGMVAFGLVRAGVTLRNAAASALETESGIVQLSRDVRAGAALSSRASGVLDQLTLAFDADVTTRTTASGDMRRLAGGVETWWFQRRVGVRAGLSGSTLGASRTVRAFGASVEPVRHVAIDGSWSFSDDEEWQRWGVGLRVTY